MAGRVSFSTEKVIHVEDANKCNKCSDQFGKNEDAF
jgi:hypothetical protein